DSEVVGCGLRMVPSILAYLLLLLALIAQFPGSESRSDPRGSRITTASGGITCSNDSFHCLDGRCIPPTWKCDGDFDCANHEDEEHCEATCTDDQFMCGNTGKTGKDKVSSCIPKKWVCDGELDCDDQSDEKNCHNVQCKENQFQCLEQGGKYKICIPSTWKCDGQNDCSDGADEKNCEEKKHCGDNEFDCGNNLCIFMNWKCDGEDDCGNKADEPANCTKKAEPTCNLQTMFKCSMGEGCIPKEWKCDGEADCHDRSDENGCEDSHKTCKLDTEFACKSGNTCINKLWICDGEKDCADGSDEKDCEEAHETCPKGQKQCSESKRCIVESLWCNGIEDCPAGEDEEECPNTNVTRSCEEGVDYTCPSMPALCVANEKLCSDNRQHNCGDDETCSSDILMCTPGSSKWCKCRQSFFNHTICHCQSGFTPDGNKQCVDVNECASPGRCDQNCLNIDGSYKCSCHKGYQLVRRDGEAIPSRCRAMGGDPLVLLSNRAQIRQFDMVTNTHVPLISSPGSAVAMDFHMDNQTLIWSDISLRKIMMCKIGTATESKHLAIKERCLGDEQTVLVEGDVHTPDGLAVDWIHDLLFWTDGALDTISVMDLKTRHRRVLFADAMEEPRAIAVDPKKGLIFWSDWGTQARIERAGMDGENRRVILTGKNIKWPNGLALDLLEERLYWADAKVKSIFSSDYYGNEVKVVLHSHSFLRHPFSLAIFEDRVFYTDWEHDGVISVNKFTGSDVTKLMTSVSTPMTVRIYHRATQPDHPNKCDSHTCVDESMCLPRAMIKTDPQSKDDVLHLPYSCVCNGNAAIDKFECLAEAISTSNGFSLPTMLFFLLICLSAIIGYVVYRQKRHTGDHMRLSFENPVYRRTTEPENSDPFGRSVGMEDVEVPVHPARLFIHEDGGHDNNTMIDSMDRPLTT
ncbi:hypothetical protein PENTCL1PPCAC_6829, partial [Pristionchus entomophagus]